MRIRIYLLVLLSAVACSYPRPENPVLYDSYPPIAPDYLEVTLPYGVAPLNFDWNGSKPIERIFVRCVGARGKTIEVSGRTGISIRKRLWRALLKANTGSYVQVSVNVLQEGKWIVYHPFVWTVSEDPIDPYVAYRLVAPGYKRYGKMGIYQRRLSSYHQMPVFENTRVAGSSVGYHGLRQTDPGWLTLQLGGSHGGTLVQQGGKMLFMDTRLKEHISSCVNPYWHPEGRYIAFSNNLTYRLLPVDSTRRMEMYDSQSDVLVYDVQGHNFLYSPLLRTEDLATSPAFSPDGRWLYFCLAPYCEMPASYDKIRYNICRIAFDPETGDFGSRIDTVVNCAAQGLSAAFPRPSYDGRFLVFTVSGAGAYPLWHQDADLALLSLATGKWEKMDIINSGQADSDYSWSGNSRWLLFSSRRGDGLYTRLYIAHIDSLGKASKPFVLPQARPGRYEANSLYGFDSPEFMKAPISLDAEALARKALKNR